MVSSSPTSNSWHQPCKCCIRHHHQHLSGKASQCHPMILNLAWSSVLHCASLYITHHHYSKSPKYKWTKAQFRFELRPVYTLAETVVVQHNLCCYALLLCCCAFVLCCCTFVLCSCAVLLCCCADPGASLVSRRCPKQSRRRRQLSCSSSCYPTETRQLSNIYS